MIESIIVCRFDFAKLDLLLIIFCLPVTPKTILQQKIGIQAGASLGHGNQMLNQP